MKGELMKEARIITIIFIVLSVVMAPILYFCSLFNSNFDWCGIGTNLYCGIIVGLITSVCQYFIAKNRIINNIYSLYFDLYRTYYYTKNNSFLYHYNAYNLYKRMCELSPKVSENLSEYHAFFRKYDKIYFKLNPKILCPSGFRRNNIIKSIFLFFNKKQFIETFSPFMKDVENILININETKFIKDRDEMIKLYNFFCGSSK